MTARYINLHFTFTYLSLVSKRFIRRVTQPVSHRYLRYTFIFIHRVNGSRLKTENNSVQHKLKLTISVKRFVNARMRARCFADAETVAYYCDRHNQSSSSSLSSIVIRWSWCRHESTPRSSVSCKFHCLLYAFILLCNVFLMHVIHVFGSYRRWLLSSSISMTLWRSQR